MSKTQADFDRYHEENPEVYQLFVEYTFEKIEAGNTQYSAYRVMQGIRWPEEDGRKVAGFKVDHNYMPRYARKFMQDYPEYEGFFRINKLKDEKVVERKKPKEKPVRKPRTGQRYHRKLF